MAKTAFLVEVKHGEKRKTSGGNESGGGSRGWTGGQRRARVGGLRAVNTTEGTNIGSTYSFAEAGTQEDAKCSERDFSDFVQPEESSSTLQLTFWK